MGARLAPASVRLLALLAEAYRYSEIVASKGMYPLEDAFDKLDVRLARKFARLENEAPVSLCSGPFGFAYDFVGVHPVAVDI